MNCNYLLFGIIYNIHNKYIMYIYLERVFNKKETLFVKTFDYVFINYISTTKYIDLFSETR